MPAIHGELLVRIFLGTLLGAVIGFERDLHGRPAGLRTHSIVALASATFMVISTRFTSFQNYLPGQLVETDPSRIAASVVSGIGFLGAGAILRTGITIRGLTTAAGLWLVAAIGMAAGLAALTLLRRLEDRGETIARQRVTVTMDGAQPVSSVVEALGQKVVVVSQEEYERQEDGGVRVMLDVRTPATVHGHELARALDAVQGIRTLKIERL
jgi:putative Mg2+ transporter-C (MgtC) family protein